MIDRRHLLLSAGAAAISGCASPPPAAAPPAARPPSAPSAPPPRPEQQLSELLDDIFRETLAENPELATSLGLDTGANAAAKSRLQDASLASVDRRRRRRADQLRRLAAIDRAALSGMAAVNYDCILHDLRATAQADQRFAWGVEGANSPYVLSQITGAYQEVPDFLASQHTIETAADCEAYVARLEAFAEVMAQEAERVRHDVALGVIPPDFVLKAALGQMRTLHAPPETSSLVASLADRARAKGLPGDWRAAATAAYAGKVLPALERQIALLSELQPRASHEAGVWRLPDGEAYYGLALADRTTTALTPAEVHEMGLEVTRELSARADVLFRGLGMTRGTVGERYQALYRSKRDVYPNTEAGKARLVADLNRLVQDMQARLPQDFATLPRTPLEIRRIPKATEQGASTHYTEGSLDGTRPGVYWINLRDTAESPFWFMPTTTFHEGIPGHHLQLTLQRQADLPLIRKATAFTAYEEGWALYAEQLAQEMGFYASKPLWELGYVHDALLRSGRLITDTGLHSLRWSRERAIRELSAIDGDPPSLSAQEVERYCVIPGQACSYMVGKRRILALRDEAKRRLAGRFDLRRFHDALLLSGAMPLGVLEGRIGDWIVAQG